MDYTKTKHWKCSCALNALLGGRADEPVCSRVYRQGPSRFRSWFLDRMDRCFDETAHCLRVHAQFLLYSVNQRFPAPAIG